MNATQGVNSLIAVGGGTLLSMLAGGVLAVPWAFGFWQPAEAAAVSTIGLAVASLLVGSTTGLAIGGIMAMHGRALGATQERGDAAPLWGILAGMVMGLSLGPVFGGATGMFAGFLVEGGIFGLLFGPIAGVLGWQCSFWLTDLGRGAEVGDNS